MFRRRRPLARAAVVGGAGYALGKRMQDRRAGEETDQQNDDAPPEAEEQAPPSSDSALADLEKLAALKEKGLLTDYEFAVQKDKLLRRI